MAEGIGLAVAWHIDLRRVRWLLLALATCTASPGCSLFVQAARDLCYEAQLKVQDTVETHRDRQLADQAYAQTHGDPHKAPDFAHGFKTGYVEYLKAGGTGLPPPLPPRHYWGFKYQSPEGHQAIEQWFAGYRAGALAAKTSGGRELVVVPAHAAPPPPPLTIAPPPPVILPPVPVPAEELPRPRPATGGLAPSSRVKPPHTGGIAPGSAVKGQRIGGLAAPVVPGVRTTGGLAVNPQRPQLSSEILPSAEPEIERTSLNVVDGFEFIPILDIVTPEDTRSGAKYPARLPQPQRPILGVLTPASAAPNASR
jgi:hypothetical protein